MSDSPSDQESHIVVGIDDSVGARTALRWAAAEARLRGARLDVLHVWAVPAQWAQGYGIEWTIDLEALGDDAQKIASDLVDTMLTEAEKPERLTVTAIEGNASSVLMEAAKSADLLVVGTRGRGGFSRLLLGSVSSAIAHHAICPLVIVPTPKSDDDQQS